MQKQVCAGLTPSLGQTLSVAALCSEECSAVPMVVHRSLNTPQQRVRGYMDM